MKHTLRRQARKLDDAQTLDLVRRCNWGVLSTVGPDGEPYGTPLNYAVHEQDGRMTLVVHCAREGRKIDNLRHHPQAAFVVVEDPRMLPEKFSTAYASAMLAGRVDIVDEPVAKKNWLTIYVEKLAPDFTERGEKHIDHHLANCYVLLLHVDEVCGKRRKFEEPYALQHLGY